METIISHKNILSDLMPKLIDIVNSQKQGRLGMSGDTAYAFSRNHKQCLSTMKNYQTFHTKQMEKHCKFKEDGKTPDQTADGKLIFKDQTADELFMEAMTEYENTQDDFTPYQIFIDDIKAIGNFPIEAIGVLEDFGIISSIPIEKNKIVSLHAN